MMLSLTLLLLLVSAESAVAAKGKQAIAFAVPQHEAGSGALVHVPHRDLVGTALAKLAEETSRRKNGNIANQNVDFKEDENRQVQNHLQRENNFDDSTTREEHANPRIDKDAFEEDTVWRSAKCAKEECVSREMSNEDRGSFALAERHEKFEYANQMPASMAGRIVHGYALVRRLANFVPTTWLVAKQQASFEVRTQAPTNIGRTPSVSETSSNEAPRLFLPGGSELVLLRRKRRVEQDDWCEWSQLVTRGEQMANRYLSHRTVEEVTFSSGQLPSSPPRNKKSAFAKEMNDFELHDKFAAGSQGEVWEAFRINAQGRKDRFVLKRIFLERGEAFMRAGLREVVFGKRLQPYPEVARFVETFNKSRNTLIQTEHSGGPFIDMWLVFRHEGESLDALLYSRIKASKMVVLEPSELWHRMRRDALGAQVRREILRQVCEGLVLLAQKNVAHRDIKPSNLLVSELASPRSSRAWPFQVKLADFGSALDTKDAGLNSILYGPTGPTMHEETRWYRPPEAFLAAESSRQFPYMANDLSGVEDTNRPLPFHAFDMWSVGVVALEMLLGTAHIFEVSDRVRARHRARLEQISYLYSTGSVLEAVLESHCAFEALQSFGIAPPGKGANRTKFRETLKQRDPLKIGYYFPHAAEFNSVEEMEMYADNELDFVWWLLQWSPFDRPLPEEALSHPFFTYET